LRDRCCRYEGNGVRQTCRIEWPVSEESEIHGLTMAEMQRDDGPAIEHELQGDFGQLEPKPPLPLR
jgi:hypothetical protein